MKTVTLVHTVRSVYESFEPMLRAALPGEVQVSNTLDEFLSVDANRRGEFTADNARRLLLLLQAKDLEAADLIITTCSTLTPVVEQVRPFLRTPLIAIDDAMMAQAVRLGSSILVLATAGSAMGPAKAKLALEAEKAGVDIAVSELLRTDAFKAIQSRNREEHDRLLREAAASIAPTVDVIVLAQASMAHLQEEIETISGRPALSSPRPCLEQVRRILYGKEALK